MKTGLEGKSDRELLRVLRQGEAMQVAARRDNNIAGHASWVMAGRALVALVHVETAARVFGASMGVRR